MKFAFVRDHRHRWPVTIICRVLQVTRSGFYEWLKRKPSARTLRQEQLLTKIRLTHAQCRERYGSPRVHRALLNDGEVVSRNTVAKLMKRLNLQAKTRRRYLPRTTDSTHVQPVAVNVLDRDFTAPAPDRKWVADITYVATGEGWLYVAAVLDCFSRKIVGWSMAEHMETDLVSDALKMALQHRQPDGTKLLHHSDRGVQYASDAYQHLLEQHGITISMSHRGDCYDNAMMESFWATLKTELVHDQKYATREQAKQSIFEYVEVFYNRKRLHSSLGYVSPESFEAAA
jgi:transposase InsO family protein